LIVCASFSSDKKSRPFAQTGSGQTERNLTQEKPGRFPQGIFRITPPENGVGGFAGNCSAQINPQRAGRGEEKGDADSQRIWLGTLLPLQPGACV
jgi:hypothetical protein